jgi:hypothetical protein
MKWVSFSLLAAVTLAILALSISAPMLSSGAYANKMDGKGSRCSDRYCKGINSRSRCRTENPTCRAATAYHVGNRLAASESMSGIAPVAHKARPDHVSNRSTSPPIVRGPLPKLADIAAKVENRTTLQISRKLIFGLLCCCVAFQRHYGGQWSI